MMGVPLERVTLPAVPCGPVSSLFISTAFISWRPGIRKHLLENSTMGNQGTNTQTHTIYILPEFKLALHFLSTALLTCSDV
jgi:hypothetical protein